MPDPLPLRIFVASPSDLDSEREVVREVVADYNTMRSPVSNIAYEQVEWAQVRGTARRPQEAIDELIPESHFMVVLFKSSWGGDPGGSWGYTSGTEEELFTGLIDLARQDRPMKDVWVAFMDGDPDARITSLRRQMVERHAMMYEAIPDADSLRRLLRERLESWESIAHSKRPRRIDLVPSSDRDVLRAASLRLDGEMLIELGQAEVGHQKLQDAAAIGGPLEHLALSRSLARRGDFDGAMRETQSAIEFVALDPQGLYHPLAAESFAAQAGMLRRARRSTEAIARLVPALDLLVSEDEPSRRVRARIHDELGLAHQDLGDYDRAHQELDAALAIRTELGDESGTAQSQINLARLAVAAGDLEVAAQRAAEGLHLASRYSPVSLQANAQLLSAQIELRRGHLELGADAARRSSALNEQIGNSNGVAIAELVLAQCLRASSNFSDALVHATRSLELNVAAGNEFGTQRAQWLIDHMRDGA
jgi:tetratricopeptide (TPR) repeat protein